MEMNQNSEIIKVFETENFAKVEILDNCSLIYFFNELSKKLSKEKFKSINIDLIFSDNNIAKKIVYIIKKENKIYNIITKENLKTNETKLNKKKYVNTSISEKNFTGNKVDEFILNLLPNDNYSIKQTTGNINGVTDSIHLYEKKENSDIPHFRKLNKKVAIKQIRKLLSDLEEMKEVNDIVEINLIADYVNVITEKDFHKVVGDDAISLSIRTDNSKIKHFDIILNKTMEKIGEIDLSYKNTDQNTYVENINYKIFKEHKNKKFSSRALKLLKEYLNQLNNHPNIKDEVLNCSDSIKKVKIYQRKK